MPHEPEHGAVNPRHTPDSRFDPVADLDNEIAHEMDAVGASSEPRPEIDPDELHGIVQRMLEDAVSHYEEELEPDQVKATEYYHGRPFGDEKDGRSKVISTDVRDATMAQMPSLMRIFAGPERVVEFRPRQAEDAPIARQQTEYVNYVFMEDNEGFLTLHSVFKDALVRRLGIVKWWYEAEPVVHVESYTGLSQEQLFLFLGDPNVEVEITARYPAHAPIPGAPPLELFDANIVHVDDDGRHRVEAVPPDEFVYTPNARSLDTAPLVAHVREVPASELIEMGIDPDLVEENVGRDRNLSSEDLDSARQFHAGSVHRDFTEDSRDPSQRPVVYAEAYALVDRGDGISERRLFQCVGPSYEIANGDGVGERVDDVPFALFTPEPEPHTIVGLSNYDLLKDVQRVKSQLERGMLDSLAKSIDPPMVVQEGEVNMQDVLNPEASNIIRTRRDVNTVLRELSIRFAGADALPALAYQDEKKENRTGTTKAAAGLDADALQSSTKAAVAATLSGSQQRIELIARIFAETGMKRLFKGLLRSVVRHQNHARVVRLRNEYVEVDPRSWDADMDVRVNVALGQGTPEDRIQLLQGILSKQEMLLQAGSPLVSHVEYRHTLGRAVELGGFQNSEEFFRPWSEQDEQQLQQQMAQKPKEPDPQMLLVQIEQLKAETDRLKEEAKIALERQKMILEDDRERDKLARETALKEMQAELKYRSEMDDRELREKIEEDRKSQDNGRRAAEAAG